MFLTHVLFNSPRLRFSQAQKVAVLDWAKQLHAVDVPTLNALNVCQKNIEGIVGHPTEKFVTSSGTVFYINDIAKAIAQV
jgi:hypothetical protein